MIYTTPCVVCGEATQVDYGTCLECAEDLLALPPAQRTIDHIVPVSKGGPNDTSNLQPMCARCNSSKKDRLCPT